MTRGEYGLMIDYKYCSGCHACEVACKKEHDMPRGDFGIKLVTQGPFQTSDGRWEFDNIPIPTHLCDLCAARTAAGKLPSCVHHCQAGVMVYGPVEELTAKAKKAEAETGAQMVIFPR